MINYKEINYTFYLRKKSSINTLNALTSQWSFYTRLFTVQSGMDTSNGIGECKTHDFSSSYYDDDDHITGITINFLTTGKLAAIFSWQDQRTLSQIDQMSGYKVKPRGVVVQFKHGGFVVYEKDGHGLVAAITGLGKMNWNAANTACDELILNGYSDWHLPTKEELNALYVNLKQVGVRGFGESEYWSSTEYNNYNCWMQHFDNGNQNYNTYLYNEYNVRAVRAF
jgi:hypothetical protein